MGAWGLGPFDNDDAGDWAWGLEESDGFSAVQDALQAVVGGDDYLEAPTCSEAVAAAETVAACLGRPVDGLPDEVRTWVGEHPVVPRDIIDLARRAVTAIEARSELRELWEETEHFDDWRKSMSDLAARLRG